MKITIKKKKGKERTRKSVGLRIFIFTKQSMFLEYTSTLQTTPIELNLIINVICFGCSQG